MKITNFSLAILLLTVFISISCFSQKNTDSDNLPSLKDKKILLVYGGWEGHQPKEYAKKINDWLTKEGAIVTMSDSLGVYTQKNILKNTDIIIQHWTMGVITDKQSAALLNAVKNGVNIAGCHGGLGDSFRNNTDYQYMIGGQFVQHPGGSIDFNVDIVKSDNPITKGLKSFKVSHSEQYYMHIDPRVKVLATTTFSGEYDYWIKDVIMPICWTTTFGKGNVFYMSIGHNLTDLDSYEAWQLYTRGIRSLAK